METKKNTLFLILAALMLFPFEPAEALVINPYYANPELQLYRISIDNGVKVTGPDWSATFKPSFNLNNGYSITWDAIPPNIGKRLWKTQTDETHWKYGVDFSYLTVGQKNSVMNVTLRLVGSENLTWSDVRLDSSCIIVKEKVSICHDDILASYTIPLINRTDVVIGNLTGNWIGNPDGTFNISFDPTITITSEAVMTTSILVNVTKEAGNSDSTNFTHLYDDLGVFRGCSYFNLSGFDKVLMKNTTLVVSSVNTKKGSLSGFGGWEYEMNILVDKEQFAGYVNKTEKVCTEDNLTKKEICHDEVYQVPKYVTVKVPSSMWLPADKYLKAYADDPLVKTKKSQAVRYCADYKREAAEKGFEVSIDIIPEFNGVVYSMLTWWNSTWVYKRPVIVENANATDILYANWTVNISIDTSDGARFQVNCSDLRITYGDSVELDRNITGCGLTDTQVWFSLQKDIAVSSNDTNYQVYYGNPAATKGPTDELKVFLIPRWQEPYIPIAAFANYAGVKYLNDSSPQENNGTEVTAGGKQSVDCLFGKCVNFSASGNYDYQIPLDSSFDTGTGNFAMAFWMLYNGGTWNGQDAVFDWRGGGEQGGVLMMYPESRFYFLLDGPNGGNILCNPAATFQKGAWYHVVAVGNESACTIYLNGVNIAGATGTAQGDLFTGNLYVGGRYDTDTAHDFRGRIENLIWFNNTITAADIDKMYWWTNGQPNPQTYLGAEESTGPDTNPPDVNWSAPTANGTQTANWSWIFWNITVNENMSIGYIEINGTNTSCTAVNASVNTQCHYNQTGLTNQNEYCSRGWASDANWNWNVTETTMCMHMNYTAPYVPPPVKPTVCSVKPILIFERRIKIAWLFDC